MLMIESSIPNLSTSFQVLIHSSCGAGAMLPFTSREDVDLFVHLEMYLRQEHPPLCGRDHLAFRSAYFPVKDVVDGDLCEQYAQVMHPFAFYVPLLCPILCAMRLAPWEEGGNALCLSE